MQSENSKNRTHGFTIVELLIVVVVIAILAAITIVAYNGITRQAENARFLSTIDSYQKSLMLYEATTGDTAVMRMSPISPLVTQTGSDAAPFVYKQTDTSKCAPGNYPAGNGFEEGECFRLEATYSGGEVEGRTAQIFTSSDWYGSTARMRGASISVPNPTFTKGEVSTMQSELSPEEGGGQVQVVYRTRGVIQHCADPVYSPVPHCGTIKLMYLILGDQSCGRGEKLLTDMEGAMYQLMSGGIGEFPEPPESPTVTVCTLAIPQ